ncbi:MAG: prolyl oligopeptidase family serine peptidase [Acidimicrobiia bacterium]
MSPTLLRRFLGLSLAVVLALGSCGSGGSSSSVRGAGTPFAYDSSLPLHVKERRIARRDGYVAYKVTYRSDGQTAPGYLTLPTGGRGSHPCLMVQHGFGGDKETARSLWSDMARAGIGTFAIDARLHGERGTPRQLVAAGRTAKGVRAMLQGTVVDLRRALDYLSKRRGCDPHRLAFFGMSMGSFLGAMLAGADSRIRATVLLVGGADWRTFLEQTRGWESVGIDLAKFREDPVKLNAAVKELDPVDPAHWVGRISPRPLLMFNGDADTIVPPDSAKALHRAARKPKDVVWFQGGHGAFGLEFLKIGVVFYTWLEVKLGVPLRLPTGS